MCVEGGLSALMASSWVLLWHRMCVLLQLGVGGLGEQQPYGRVGSVCLGGSGLKGASSSWACVAGRGRLVHRGGPVLC